MDNDEAVLTGIIRRCSFPMSPFPPPPLPPGWEILPEPEPAAAVLFDIYGTLFCSAAGDLGGAAGDLAGSGEALDELAGEYAPGLGGEGLRDYFRQGTRKIHGELAGKTSWPELRVEELWTRFLQSRGGEGDLSRKARELALRYELAVNPVYPMPGAEETIKGLAEFSTVLGLISNAQFYTPLLFTAFFGGRPEEIGFDPALLVYSFETGEAKPAKRLFSLAADRLAERGIDPGSCLYVGNDMLKDVYGAASAGFRTALFAGDGRSLRLREGDGRLRGLRPTRIIRHLTELLPRNR
ncbi:MAG: HAD family hydrolase [Treponema sp.]|jgi:putative hydrolase of the HAD superfamily|nr:HAD family hydrolase [Treponema sp.]